MRAWCCVRSLWIFQSRASVCVIMGCVMCLHARTCVLLHACVMYDDFFNLVQAYIFINVPMCGMTICDAFCFYLTHITIFYNLKALHTFNLVSFACHIVRLAGRCSCLCTTCPRMKCAWYVFAGHLRPHTRAHTHIHAHAPYNHSHSARTHTHTHAHAPYTYSHTPHAHEHTRTYALPHVNDKRRTKTETKSKNSNGEM